jgi:hypothetical protein
MNRLFIVLATLLAASALVPSAGAVPDSVISVVGTGHPATLPGAIPGCIGPQQISFTWVYVCSAGTFTVTFDSITTEVEATVNGQAELLQAGTYTFSEFAGQLTIQRTPNTNDFTYVINGVATVS